MKLLLLSLIFIAAAGTISAMQVPLYKKSVNVTYNGPFKERGKQWHVITAIAEGKQVGSVYFDFNDETESGNIVLLDVDEDFRNLRIGFNLFQKAITAIHAYNTNIITWTAIPTDNISLAQLRIIYKKMVKKLDSAENYEFTIDDMQGKHINKIPMKLELIKK